MHRSTPTHRSTLATTALAALALAASGCASASTDAADDTATSSSSSTSSTPEGTAATTGLDTSLFVDGALSQEPTTEDCTLSGGAETTCWSITVAGAPADHEVGPFCPPTITSGAEEGGTWFDGDALYDVDGAFIEGLAETYDDDAWKMYDEDGDVLSTDTAEDFQAATASPEGDPAYENYCIQGEFERLEGSEPIPATVLIPTEPVAADEPATSRSDQGVTLDGVIIAASAPVEGILASHALGVFDDCGGHLNPYEGYHLHGALGCSEVGEATEGETAQFGYAMDGYAVHSPLEGSALTDADLDGCGGHTTEADGYHYHANPASENQVIACLVGQTVASDDAGGGPPGGGGPPADG